jgi:hypothetical protein
MRNAVTDVTEHLTGPFLTRFWDYLLWSTSPIILAFAVIGVRQLLEERRELLAVVTTWCLPFFAFYFASTTSPRYFLPTAVPVALCASVGVVALVPLLAPRRRWPAWIALAGVSTAHLFIGLSHFTPRSLRSLLDQSMFETHVGPLWTGAFLYKSYFEPSFLGRSLRHDGFGKMNPVSSIIDSNLGEVAAGVARGRTILVIPGGWNRHMFHFYAHAHGAKYVNREPGPFFDSETQLTLGGATLIWRPAAVIRDRPANPLPVDHGDLVWMLWPTVSGDSVLRQHLSANAALKPVGDPKSSWMMRYRIERISHD